MSRQSDTAKKVMQVLDPAFVNRSWSVLDSGNGSRMRDVMRAYEQIKLTEALLERSSGRRTAYSGRSARTCRLGSRSAPTNGCQVIWGASTCCGTTSCW